MGAIKLYGYDCEKTDGDIVVVRGIVSVDKLVKSEQDRADSNGRIVPEDFVFTLRQKGDNAYSRLLAEPHNGCLQVPENHAVYDCARQAGFSDINCRVPAQRADLQKILDKYGIRPEAKPKKETTCLFYQGTDDFPEEEVLAEFNKMEVAIETGNWGTELELHFHPKSGCIEYRMRPPEEEGIALGNNEFCLAMFNLPKVLQRKLRSINGFRL